MVPFSGSEVVEVAIVVPVEVSSENDSASKVKSKEAASLTSSIFKVNVELTVLVPFDALKVKL